jgi:hypothetical protein
MSQRELPENFEEHGKEFNRISMSDAERLNPKDRAKFELLGKNHEMEKTKTQAANERYRETRIDGEVDRLLRRPAPSRDGPVPNLGTGRPRPESVAREPLSPEQLRSIRDTAQQNVLKAEQGHLQKLDRTYNDAQRQLLDRALGPDRYPAGREGNAPAGPSGGNGPNQPAQRLVPQETAERMKGHQEGRATRAFEKARDDRSR